MNVLVIVLFPAALLALLVRTFMFQPSAVGYIPYENLVGRFALKYVHGTGKYK
jgi:hypothetical protein